LLHGFRTLKMDPINGPTFSSFYGVTFSFCISKDCMIDLYNAEEGPFYMAGYEKESNNYFVFEILKKDDKYMVDTVNLTDPG